MSFDEFDCNLSIDLDDDVSRLLDEKDNYIQFTGIQIDPPQSTSAYEFSVFSGIRINQLSDQAIGSLAFNFSLPNTLSIANWRHLADRLNLNSNKWELTEEPVRELLREVADSPLESLLEAIVSINRIDVIAHLQKLRTMKTLFKATPSFGSRSTLPIDTSHSAELPNLGSSLKLAYDYKKYILVNHHETTSEEKKIYKWFMKNLREFMRLYSDLSIIDITEIEKQEHDNMTDIIHYVYSQVEHIIICFNPSYIKLTNTMEERAQTKYRSYVHQLAGSEFVNNGMKNKRCRCVLLAGAEVSSLVGWPSVTYQYVFPETIKQLFERLSTVTQQLTTM